MPKVVVYTAIMGDYEWLRPTKFPGICLADSKLEPAEGWEIRRVERAHTNSRRASRHPKMMPHKYFPKAEYTIYLDGNVRLLRTPALVIKDLLRKKDIALFPHSQRACIYQEAEKCIEYKKADPIVVAEQMKYYRAEGFPTKYGLTACWVIIRRNTPGVQRFGETWWEEYLRFSCRDQLSFDFVRWRLRMRYDKIPGDLFKNTSRYFQRCKHLKGGSSDGSLGDSLR